MWFVTFMDKVNKVLKYFLFISFFITTIALTLQVVMRFVFDNSLSWSEELSRYLVIWITFVGASIAVRDNRLIRIEVLLAKMPATPTRVINILSGLISLFFYAILVYFGVGILDTVVGQDTPSMQISMAIPYAAIPVGALLMILNTIASILDPKKGGNEL